MINEALGVRSGSAIDVAYGHSGHAVYGPYVAAEAGEYIAEFRLEPLESGEAPVLCALVEAVCDIGQTVLARAGVFSSQISETHRYELRFALGRRVEDLELRVLVNGTARVRIIDECTHRAAQDSHSPIVVPRAPRVYEENARDVDNCFANGFKISGAGDELIAEHSNVALRVRSFDDLRFLGEIFLSRTYDLAPFSASILVDIGMNIGLTSLLLAQNPKYEEIYAFEPFPQTYRRALENLALNPGVAGKIRTFNIGLSDRDDSVAGYFSTQDSGRSSTMVAGEAEDSAPVAIRDAAGALEPIFAHAQESGRRIIMKIDCEGSEFAVFRSLAGRGLLDRVTAVMVEWHLGFGDKNELFRALSERNFIVIDQSPPAVNGFFYAVRAG